MFESIVMIAICTIPLILIYGIFKLIMDLCSVIHEKQHKELKDDFVWKINQKDNCLKNGDFIAFLSVVLIPVVLFVFISTGFIGGCLATVLSYFGLSKLSKILE